MNIQLIEITPLNQNFSNSGSSRPRNTSDLSYTAIAIEENGKFYYWANGVGIEISAREHESVLTNPKLYYFSTALKLHHRLKKEVR